MSFNPGGGGGISAATDVVLSNPANGQALTYSSSTQKWTNSQVLQPIRFSASTAMVGLTGSDRAYGSRVLTGARMRVTTAPVGSSLTVQVRHSTGGGSWATLGSDLVIPAGSTAEVLVSFNQAQAVGDLIALNVVSVGSTTAAEGVIVDVIWG